MRSRPMLVLAAAAAVGLAIPAHAGTPTLDGKKTKELKFSLKSAPQSNDINLATDFVDIASRTPVSRPENIAACPKTRCLFYTFVYKPAKGVRPGPLSVRITWSVPGQDYDLYVVKNGADVGHCGASAGTSEVVVIPTPTPKATYQVVVDQYRSVGDTITGKVDFPATDHPSSTVPGTVDSLFLPVNCGM